MRGGQKSPRLSRGKETGSLSPYYATSELEDPPGPARGVTHSLRPLPRGLGHLVSLAWPRAVVCCLGGRRLHLR